MSTATNLKVLIMSQFSDLKTKLQHAMQLIKVEDPTTKTALFPNAVKAVVNAHGRFYGLRSKYHGNGNLRTPMTASVYG